MKKAILFSIIAFLLTANMAQASIIDDILNIIINSLKLTGYAVADVNLVAYYKFNETSGATAADSSINANTGTLTNNPTWVAGKMGNALSFDGADDYVKVSDSNTLDISSSITVMAWIKTADCSGRNEIAQKEGAYGLKLESCRLVGYFWGASEPASTATISTNTWYHVAYTYNGSVRKYYVNGVLDSSHSTAGSIPTSNNELKIGRGFTDADYFNGVIDEVKIYNKALSSQDVSDDAATITPTSSPTPAPNQTGRLSISAVDDKGISLGSVIFYIDNIQQSAASLTSINVSVGPHTIKVTKEGYEDYAETINVVAGQVTTVVATLEAQQMQPVPNATPTPPPEERQPISTSELIDMGVQLEAMRVSFSQLKTTVLSIADYYDSVGDIQNKNKFTGIAGMFDVASQKIEDIKRTIQDNLDKAELLREQLKATVKDFKDYLIQILSKILEKPSPTPYPQPYPTPSTSVCGNVYCEPDEDAVSCPQDCAQKEPTPTRANGFPQGTIYTSYTLLYLIVDEDATCRYSTTEGTNYDQMPEHTETSRAAWSLTNLEDGVHHYYIRCKDLNGNVNTDDYVISFAVDATIESSQYAAQEALAQRTAQIAEVSSTATTTVPESLLDTSYDMKVIVIKYFPLTSDGQNIDITVTGDVGESYSVIRQRTIDGTNILKASLEKASTYLGYKDSNAQPALRYEILYTFEYTKPVPIQTGSTNKPDLNKTLQDHYICTHVDSEGVREVWLWAYQGPGPQLDISESQLTGPIVSFSNGPYYTAPVCDNTYRIYSFNLARAGSEPLEAWGHQMEFELRRVDRGLFNDRFQGPAYPVKDGEPGRCGSVHNPPNARFEYDRVNRNSWSSDCLNWNPDINIPSFGSPQLSSVSCENWGCMDRDPGDNPALNYMVWNWQNLPGRKNDKTYQDKKLRNWWDVHGDFDSIMRNGKRLTISILPQRIELSEGWNFIGLTVDKGSFYTARDFLRDLNENFVPDPNKQGTPPDIKITDITKYSNSEGRNLRYVLGDNFTIVPGEGYAVHAEWSGATTVYGENIRRLPLIRTPPGRSYISFPRLPPGITTAQNLLQAMQQQGINATLIEKRNRSGGFDRYSTSDPNYNVNFNINPGEGYIINNEIARFIRSYEEIRTTFNPSDIILPQRSDGFPSGTIYKTSPILSLVTSEIATCRYSTTAGTKYIYMQATTETGLGRYHGWTLTGLAEGQHTYYVKCMDESGNRNTDDYTISFTVARASTSQTIPLSQGTNLVGLTIDAGSYTARDFLRDLNESFVPDPNKQGTPPAYTVNTIRKYSEGSGSITYDSRFPLFNNFPIVLGEGYVVQAAWSGNSAISGASASLSSMTIPAGRSYISFPRLPSGITTADDLLRAMQQEGINVNGIERYNTNTRRFETYSIGGDTPNFNIDIGEGYFINNEGRSGTFYLVR